MTTVSSSLKLFDAMTKPLQNITNALNLTISAMQSMQHTTNQNSNVSRSLAAAKNQIAAAEAQIRSSIDQSNQAQQRFNASVKEGKRQTEDMLGSVKRLVAAYIGFHVAKDAATEAIKSAGEQRFLQDMFAARIGNADVGAAMFETFKKEALRVGADVKEYLQGTLGNLSITTNTDQLKQLNMLAKQLSAFDTTGQGIEGAFFSLKEAMSGDIVSLSERFNMSKSLIRKFKVDQLGKSGDVEGFIKAFNKLLDAQNMGHEAFERMLDSPIKKAEILQNKLKQMFADSGQNALNSFMPVIDLLNNAFENGKMEKFFNSFSSGLSMLANLTASVIGFMLDHWSTLQNVILAIGVVVSAVAAIWIVEWMIAAWPVFAIIGGITLLLELLNTFGISTGEVVSYVSGAFAALFAFIYNKIGFLWNNILAFAEFFVNIFIDPVYAVKKLFYDLAKNFLGYMYNMIKSAEDFGGSFTKTILHAVNKALEGFNWLVDKVNDMFGTNFTKAELFDENNINAVSDRLKDVMDMLEAPTSDKNVVDFSKYKMEFKDPKASFDSGYKAGTNFVNKTKQVLDTSKILDDWNKSAGPSNNIPNIDKVKKVGKIEDKVDISSEDLKMMRELAEMKSIQNFVTLNPTVNMTTGPVSKEADVDEIMYRIEKTIMEDIASSAAGVYGHG